MRTANLSSNFLIPNDIPAQRYLLGGKEYNGFENRTSSTIGMSGTTSAFVISGNSYNIWSGGKKYTNSGILSTGIPYDKTLHYIYFDNYGNLNYTSSFWNITSDNIPTATVFKDGSGYAVMEERHGYQRDRNWHAWAHSSIGARYGSGFTGTFTNTTLSITEGVIWDEDINNSSVSTRTNCNLWYRDSSLTAMRMETNISTPYKAIAGVLQYDLNGVITPVSNGQNVCHYVYATNDINNPIYVVVGQNQYTNANITNARAESLPTIILSQLEWKLIYRVIYRNNNGVVNYVEAADYRLVSTGPSSTISSTDHGSLINRDALNAHPQNSITNLTTSDIASFAAVNVLCSTIPTNGIYLPATNTLGFSTSGIQHWYIDPSGSLLAPKELTAAIVGCSSQTTTNSGSSLTLKAGSGTGSGKAGGNLYLAAGVGASTAANGYIAFGRSQPNDTAIGLDAEWMRVDANGNLGIGTTTITPKVSQTGRNVIIGGTNGDHVTLGVYAYDTGNDRNAVLELLSSGNGVSKSQIIYGDTDITPFTPSPLSIKSYHSGTTTERLTIDSVGNVSLTGLTTLLTSTSVVSAVASCLLIGASSTGTTLSGFAPRLRFQSQPVNNGTVGPIADIRAELVGTGGTYNSRLIMGSRNGGNINDTLTLTTDGSVGINCITPNCPLFISALGVNVNYGTVSIFDSTSQAAGVGGVLTFSGYKTNQTSQAIFGKIKGLKENSTSGNEDGYLAFETNKSNSYTERMRIDSSGNVTISTGGLFVSTSKTPATSGDTGTKGCICWDSGYLYVAVDTNTWKRAALSAW